MKAIIGAVMAVIVVLVVFLVVLPLISPHGINALASTASSEFGGSWKLSKCKSATGIYIGNKTYEVKYLNGTTIKETSSKLGLSGLQFYIGLFLSILPMGSSNYYMPTVHLIYPVKIVTAMANGTVNGHKAFILVVGIHYNTTSNPIYGIYTKFNKILTNSSYSSTISHLEAKAKTEGAKCFVISSFNGMDYIFMSTCNHTQLSQSLMPNVIPKCCIVSAGTFVGISNTDEILVWVINVAPTNSQIQGIVSQIQSCL
ncbi:hypothetical protein HS5_08330 [Acidianus sp. HS-5]|nr:hypothetical protein HS5_08330 [Acidianus sp. HS-5]